ncbi:MAG: PPC domain-containing protein [Myxococcales bacterium]|nr:PPC domain-containing protein [Myxococcales bacterium]
MPRGPLRSRVAACVALALAAACATSRAPGGAFDPRFVAVHNALAAMGLAQVGPIREGFLKEGREARVTLDLPAGCTTVMVFGGEGVRDINATLVDSQGRPVAHDTTSEPEAVLRWCLESPDAYVLALTAAAGSGPWMAATWQGGAAGGAAATALASAGAKAREADGTCDAPVPLAAGTVTGSTTHGEHENAGSCGPSDSRELVYQLDVPQRQRVTIEVEAKFDSVLYVRKDDCSDPNAEVDCSDDAPDRAHSRIERVLEPGRYFVFVDGYAHDAGTFKMNVTLSDVLALSDVCRRAPELTFGVPVSGSTSGMGNDAQASCPAGAEGADAPWRLELASRARLRIVEHSDDMTPVVHVRHACADEQSEIGCGDAVAGSDAVLTGVFDPGSYTVFADAHDVDAAGRYSLQAELAPPSGAGGPGDGCGDAVPLGAPSVVQGDTFAARDDVAGSCGGAGAADLVYRLEVAKRSRFAATLSAEEAPHLLALWRRCGDRSSEVGCGRRLDEVLAPGAYFLAVDGLAEDAFGRFALQWSLQDLTVQGSACGAAPTLVAGRPIAGSTLGAGDRFLTSCGASDDAPSGPDRVYRFALGARSHVRLSLSAGAFEAALALRKACADSTGGPRAAEIACASDAGDAGQSITIDRVLEPGAYWVVVDGQGPNDQGPFTLEYRVIR